MGVEKIQKRVLRLKLKIRSGNRRWVSVGESIEACEELERECETRMML